MKQDATKKEPRWRYNLRQGRIKIKDRRLSLDETNRLLHGLEARECLSARISYDHPHISKRFFDKETTVNDAYHLVLAAFKPTHKLPVLHHTVYSEGRHVVYSDFFREEMHYFEVSSGIVRESAVTKFTPKRLTKVRTKLASIEILVKKT